MKTIRVVMGILAMFAVVGCGGKACPDLAKQVCEMAPASPACESAGRLTANDECAGYLKDVAKFVELKNLIVTQPGVQPPADEPAEPPVPEGGNPPAEPAAAQPPAAAEAPTTAPADTPAAAPAAAPAAN